MIFRNIKRYICSAFIAALLFPLSAELYAQAQDDAFDLSLSENLSKPSVPRKAQAYVNASMDQLRRHFVKNGLKVSAERGGEVIKIVVSCEDLFAPGEIVLKEKSKDLLRKLNVVVSEPRKYKMIVAVHTDDTGDEQYADSISGARADAIDDMLWQISGEKDVNIIPYGIGKDEPVAPNSSIANRALNRRVEFYIVPDEGLFDAANYRRK